ncbi:hypothetical protein FACS1894151_00970 [Spirochaetia bacterium]|nr:hypothetical protein FACS1894151_00970 [Spirochaetia bacterium]
MKEYYEVKTCESAIKAIAILEKIKVDIIIVDIEMPIMNGFEFIREIRKNPKTEKTPVIVISSNEKIWESIQHGANEYMEKPVEPEKLIKKIKEVIKNNE